VLKLALSQAVLCCISKEPSQKHVTFTPHLVHTRMITIKLTILASTLASSQPYYSVYSTHELQFMSVALNAWAL